MGKQVQETPLGCGRTTEVVDNIEDQFLVTRRAGNEWSPMKINLDCYWSLNHRGDTTMSVSLRLCPEKAVSRCLTEEGRLVLNVGSTTCGLGPRLNKKGQRRKQAGFQHSYLSAF